MKAFLESNICSERGFEMEKECREFRPLEEMIAGIVGFVLVMGNLVLWLGAFGN